MTEDATRDRMFELHIQNAERAASSQKGSKTMNEYELIDTAKQWLDAAEISKNNNQLEGYAQQMQLLLDLLIEELVGEAPKAAAGPTKTFNPEQALTEISIAIKHRTISDTHRWYIVYYHDRITCVPSPYNVPPEIVLHEFTERMIHRGFTSIYWNQLKQNVIKLYKELHK